MWCSDLLLRNFRNFSQCRVRWHPGLNLLTGRNGAGKTNCLEGLHILLGWGPLGDRKDLRAWDGCEEYAFVTGNFSGGDDLFAAAAIGRTTVLKCDGQRISSSDIRWKIPSLAFLPRDMTLIDGSPSGRRSFADRLCAVLFPLYAKRLSDFKRAVRHRTVLLRAGRALRPLSQAMATMAAWLWEARERAVTALARELEDFGDLLPLPLSLEFHRGGGGRQRDPLADWWESLEAARERECRCCVPLVGPHRDDLLMTSGGRAAGSLLSRGQKRRASVALMLAAGRVVERRLGKAPIILLDEIASELDEEGRKSTVAVLHRMGWQVIATAAEPVVRAWPGQVWRVDGGQVLPLSGAKCEEGRSS